VFDEVKSSVDALVPIEVIYVEEFIVLAEVTEGLFVPVGSFDVNVLITVDAKDEEAG